MRRIILGLLFLIVPLGVLTNTSAAPSLQVTGDWVRHEQNPVLRVPNDRALVADPTVLFDPDRNRYRLWFGHIARHPRRGVAARVGYADSPDGLRWVNVRFELVPLGKQGSWDDRDVETPHVILDDAEKDPAKRYKMWYSGLTKKHTFRIGYATSPDGLSWRKLPADRSPYRQEGLVLGLEGTEVAVSDPAVLRRGETYHMWFAMLKIKADGTLDRGIGYATSADGARWTQHPRTPVIRGSEWDDQWGVEGWPAQPYVLWNGRFYEMWYSAGLYPEGSADPAKQAIGYATSDDGVNWSKKDRPILLPDVSRQSEAQGWMPGPAAIYVGGRTFVYYPAVANDRVALHLTIRNRLER